mgnify:CR=1 FL=1
MRFFTKRFDTVENKKLFEDATPFPHIVIDNFLDDDALRSLLRNYPKIEDKSWWHYENPLEMKYAFNNVDELSSEFKTFFEEANSPDVVEQMSSLADLKGVIPDLTLRGGGLHQIAPGGKLDVHEDFNVNIDMHARRVLNMIVYLNDEWQESYGGHLQLWDAEMKSCVKSVLPVFNRAVIFRTDKKSNHGHPDPLTCPVGMTRRSLATYYYIPMSNVETYEYTSTQFKKRPSDPEDQEVEELRIKRNRGRLADKKS